MRYLLDTNVVSEFRKARPNRNVLAWLNQVDPETVYLSVITIGELKKGIEKLSDASRQQALQSWLDDDLLVRFDQRLLDLGVDILLRWGTLTAQLEKTGKPMSAVDALIAATALQGDFTLVTRNEADFVRTGVKLFNPWDETSMQRNLQ